MSALQLSIDTCNRDCSIALSQGSADSHDILATDIIELDRGHAEVLIGQIAAMMARENLKPSNLDRVVATRGPGSFTGQRVGLSAARALAAALDIEVFGIGVLPALILDAQIHLPEDSTKIAVIDARRDAIYLRADYSDGEIDDCILNLKEAVQQIDGLTGAKYLIGSGATLLKSLLQDEVTIVPINFPSIQSVATLGHCAQHTDNPATPLYLRAPDAKPQKSSLLSAATGSIGR